jgi:hypothetical protein
VIALSLPNDGLQIASRHNKLIGLMYVRCRRKTEGSSYENETVEKIQRNVIRMSQRKRDHKNFTFTSSVT